MDYTKEELLEGLTLLHVDPCEPYQGQGFVLAQKDKESVFVMRDQTFNLHYRIPYRVDRLIGQWLKLERYVDWIPYNQSILAFLFLQPVWNNSNLAIDQLTNGENRPICEPLTNSRDPMRLRGFSQTIPISEPSKNFEIFVPFSRQFPFLFLKLDHPSKDLTKKDITVYISHNNSKQIPYEIVPTRDKRIFLVIVSNIISKEKHCAKILRHFLKKPEDMNYSPGNVCLGIRSQLSQKVTVSTINLLTWRVYFLNKPQEEWNFYDSIYQDTKNILEN